MSGTSAIEGSRSSRTGDLDIRDDEQNAEYQVRRRQRELASGQASLHVQGGEAADVHEFLQHGRDHHRVETFRITSDGEECDLPRSGYSDEAVVEVGMRNRWRVLAADEIEHEIQRRQHHESPHARADEYRLRESHSNLSRRLKSTPNEAHFGHTIRCLRRDDDAEMIEIFSQESRVPRPRAEAFAEFTHCTLVGS